MNANRNHQIKTATVATVIAFVAAVGTTAPAFAGHTHDDGEGGARTNAFATFAQPIAAFGGKTMAQYIQNHQAGDARTATVI